MRGELNEMESRIHQEQAALDKERGPSSSPHKMAKQKRIKKLQAMHQQYAAKYQKVVANFCKLIMFLCDKGARKLTEVCCTCACCR